MGLEDGVEVLELGAGAGGGELPVDGHPLVRHGQASVPYGCTVSQCSTAAARLAPLATLHSCQVYTCQAGGCLNSGTNDCNSSVACGTGACIQDQHGFWPCNYANTPADHICEGEVFSQPVECCGIGFTNNSTSLVVTCPAGSGRECCTGLLGAQCCEPGFKCKLGGCGAPGIEVPG